MKGAMALPLPKKIMAPNRTMTRMTGRSQNFFLVCKKPHKSVKKFISHSSHVVKTVNKD